MPAKIRPNDWERFFSPKHRTPGPLGTLFKSLVVVAILGGLGYGAVFASQQLEEQQLAAAQTAEAIAPTQTAQAFFKTQTAQAPPTTVALERGRIIQQTALLTDPANAASVQGELFANSNIEFLEVREVEGQRWWRIRVVDQSNPGSAAPGVEGWIIGGTVTEPAEVPVAAEVAATPVPAVAPLVSLDINTLELRRDPATNISMLGAPGWQPQPFPILPLSFFLAPALDAGEGVLSVKVIDVSRDADGLFAAVDKLAFALAKPDTVPQVNVEANDGTTLVGNVVFTRTVAGQDYPVQARVMARPAPGNSVGVTLAFVPQNSYPQNESVLNQMVQGVIFQ